MIDTNELKNFEFTDMDNAFVSALKYITEGKDLMAVERLKELYYDSPDSALRSSCAELLFTLYFGRSDWEQIKTLGLLNDATNIELSNRLIAEACSKSERATFSFTNNSAFIPMKPSLTGCPTIEIEINGNRKWFWLDTGAEMTVLSTSLATECQIPRTSLEGLEVGNSLDGNFPTELGFIDSILIENLSIRNQPTLILADEMLTIPNPKTKEVMVIDGIIGWDIIQYIHLDIDYGLNRVFIKEPTRMKKSESNLFFCGSPMVKVKSANHIPLYFGLDTGASKTHFGQPLLSKIKEINTVKKTVHAGGVGEMKDVEVDMIERFTIHFDQQAITIHKSRKMLSDFGSFFQLDGVFGSDIAKGGRLIIDYINRQIKIVNG